MKQILQQKLKSLAKKREEIYPHLYSNKDRYISINTNQKIKKQHRPIGRPKGSKDTHKRKYRRAGRKSIKTIDITCLNCGKKKENTYQISKKIQTEHFARWNVLLNIGKKI